MQCMQLLCIYLNDILMSRVTSNGGGEKTSSSYRLFTFYGHGELSWSTKAHAVYNCVNIMSIAMAVQVSPFNNSTSVYLQVDFF